MEGYSSSEEEDFLSKYEFNCIGKDCIEMTNGSQYCAKTYCLTERLNESEGESDTESEEEINDDDCELYNYCEYVETQDKEWLKYERKSGYIRPENWYDFKK